MTLRLEPLEDRVTPAVLTVGPGQMYALPSQAAAAAHDGDTIDIYSNGNYSGDTCRWTQNNLTIQGVGGGRAHIDITDQTAYGDKAIWVIDGSNTTVNNIELSGAHDTLNTGHNWAGIRLEGNTLTLNNDYFHNDDDGILVNATNTSLGPTSNIAIYGSEFANNGWGDGFSHNMYIGAVTSFTLENSYSHDANEGHLVKSRALTNYILYNRLEDGSASTSTASYELDLPQGGTSYVIGNLIEQGPHSANGTIVTYAEEGAVNPGESLYLVNNTIVNDRGNGGTFVNVASGATALLENNIFCGPGTVVSGSGSVTQTTNLVSSTPGFVNQAGYDYHLTAGSPAINAGTAPGTVNGFNLTPTSEYVDPLSLQPRPVDGSIDIGAYEFVSSGSNTSVNLSSAFNREGIVTDGSHFSGGGLDGKGHALSSNLLGSSVSWNGQTFSLGSANSNNVVSATGQTISLPSGNYSTLSFLATSVNGGQKNLTFTVTYTDGTKQTFTQSISGWLSPQGYSGESKAATMAYRDSSNGGRVNRTTYVYGYSFTINSGKTVQSITLPNDPSVNILAMNLA
ncbi:MAG TPA: choice-of-anchor Q domain-containing protein [Gemmataceae bacterium]